MFYCDPCGKERGWPTDTLSISIGACECCNRREVCNDGTPKYLPVPAPSQPIRATIERKDR